MSEKLLFIIFLIFLTSVCDTISQLFLKLGINLMNFDIQGIKKLIKFVLKIALIPWAWISLIFSALSLFIWLFVLSKVDLNFAFSVDSMHYILIAIASKLILKEKVGSMRWLGTILIAIGIALVTLS